MKGPTAGTPLTATRWLESWRRLERDLLSRPWPEIELPWICMDREHEATFQRFRCPGLVFRQIGIDQLEKRAPQSNETVLLLFGSNEIGAAEAAQVRALQLRQILTVPLVLLGDAYFRVPEFEVFGYSPQMEELEQICRAPVAAFRCPAEVEPPGPAWLEYFRCLRVLLTLPEAEKRKEWLRRWQDQLGRVDRALGRRNPPPPGFRQAFLDLLRQPVAELAGASSQVLALAGPSGRVAAALSGESASGGPAGRGPVFGWVGDLQRQNAQSAKEERFRPLGLARLATTTVETHLLDLTRIVDNFVRSPGARWLQEVAASLSSEGSLATTVVTAGPFSSGKTTLLNQLLWGGEPRLKTEGRHNTAIVFEMCFGEKESVEFVWKSALQLSLLEPFDDGEYAVLSQVDGRVEAVFSGEYTAVQIISEDGRSHFRSLGHRKAEVMPGDLVAAGDKLSQGRSPESAQITQFVGLTANEQQTLEDLCRRGILQEVRIVRHGGSRHPSCLDPVDTLRKLRGLPPSGFLAYVDREPVFDAFGPLSYLGLEARICPEAGLPAGFELDEPGWQRLQGPQPYAQHPECYLLVDRAKVRSRNELLRLAALVDTPGLGSLDNHHNDVTEPWVTQRDGLLLLFVKLDATWNNDRLARLKAMVLSKRSRDFSERTLVICNVFAGSRTEREVETQLAKARRYFGDPFPHFFAIDLRRAMETGNVSYRFGNFPNFADLEAVLREKIGDYGAGRRLLHLQGWIHKILHGRKSTLESRIVAAERSKEQRQERIARLAACRSGIPSQPVTADDTQVIAATHVYKTYLPLLDTKKSWTQNRSAFVGLVQTLNRMAEDHPFNSLFSQASAHQARLAALGIHLPFPQQPEPPRGSLDVSSLDKLFDKILDHWDILSFSWLPWSEYRSEQRGRIEKWFADQTGTLRTRLKYHRRECEVKVDDYYRKAREEIDREIALLSKGTEPVEEREELRQLDQEAIPGWKKISLQIDRFLNRIRS